MKCEVLGTKVDVRRLGALLGVAAVLAGSPQFSAAADPKPPTARGNEFFPFCIDTHDAKKRNVEQQAVMLKELGYAGWYSWEDEPEDRNPFDSAVRNRRWIEKQLAAG